MKEKLTPYLRKLSNNSGISKQYIMNTLGKRGETHRTGWRWR